MHVADYLDADACAAAPHRRDVITPQGECVPTGDAAHACTSCGALACVRVPEPVCEGPDYDPDVLAHGASFATDELAAKAVST